MAQVTKDHRDVKTIIMGPTRQAAVLDVQLSNMNELLVDQGTNSPITSSQGVDTDHLTVYATFRMPRVPSYEIQDYSYFRYTDEGDELFGKWLDKQDWMAIFQSEDVDRHVEILHESFDKATKESYELKNIVKNHRSHRGWPTGLET